MKQVTTALKARVTAMRRNGYRVRTIADKTGLSLGEVRRIIAMPTKKKHASRDHVLSKVRELLAEGYAVEAIHAALGDLISLEDIEAAAIRGAWRKGA